MLVTLNFHPALQKYTNGIKQHKFDVTNLSDILDGLIVLFPKMRVYISYIKLHGFNKENLTLIKSDGTLVTKKEYEFNLLKDKTLTLCPLITGGGRFILPLLMIVAAVALIAFAPQIAAALTPVSAALGGGAISASTIVGMGIKMAISGLMGLIGAMMTPSNPSTNSSQQRRNNDMFDSFENSTDPNTSIPLVYGRTRVSGQLLSGHLETITHGESDTVYVKDVFRHYTSDILRQESY